MGYSGGFRPLRCSDRPPIFCRSCGRLNGLCGSFHPWLWCILQRKSAEGRKKETIKIIVKQEKYSEHISNNLITKPKEESVYNSVLYTCILVKNRLKDIRIGLGNNLDSLSNEDEEVTEMGVIYHTEDLHIHSCLTLTYQNK